MHHLPLDSILILQHSSRDFIDVIGEYLESHFTRCFHSTITYQLSPQHAEYVKFKPRDICIDNEALKFQLMIMTSAHRRNSTPGRSDSTNFKTLLQSTLHVNLIYGSRQVCHSLSNSPQQLYNNHCKFYDRIESWLEEYYTSTFLMNNNVVKFNFLSGYFLESILPIFRPTLPHPLQLAFNQHPIVGLELLDWLH
jgi:hypothetical protein